MIDAQRYHSTIGVRAQDLVADRYLGEPEVACRIPLTEARALVFQSYGYTNYRWALVDGDGELVRYVDPYLELDILRALLRKERPQFAKMEASNA